MIIDASMKIHHDDELFSKYKESINVLVNWTDSDLVHLCPLHEAKNP